MQYIRPQNRKEPPPWQPYHSHQTRQVLRNRQASHITADADKITVVKADEANGEAEQTEALLVEVEQVAAEGADVAAAKDTQTTHQTDVVANISDSESQHGIARDH